MEETANDGISACATCILFKAPCLRPTERTKKKVFNVSLLCALLANEKVVAISKGV